MNIDSSKVGCWADATYGHEHVRRRLASFLVLYFGDDGKVSPVVDSLDGEMPDDAWDELEALELLNSKCHQCYFEMLGGDLILSSKGDRDEMESI